MIALPASGTARLILAIGAFLIIAGAIIAVIAGFRALYQSGYDAGENAAKTEQLQALVEANQAIAQLNKDLGEKAVAYARLEAQAELQATQAPETVTRIIRENPQFQCTRPAALAAQRMQELQSIADAIGGGAPDRLPAIGVRALPAAPDQ